MNLSPQVGQRSLFLLTQKRSSRYAFSLVELLVVIAIVGTLATISVLSLRDTSKAAAVTGATDQGAALVLNAQVTALSMGYGSRLIIDNHPDPGNPDNYLRRFAVARGVYNGGSVEWQLTGRPQYLPPNTYFLVDYSEGYNDSEIFDFRNPEAQDGSTGTPVLFFQFNSSGHLDTGSTTDARLVFGSGILQGTTLITPENLLEGRKGFLLRKAGRPSYFETVAQMPTTNSSR